MKTIKILALTAMTAALTACSNDDEVIINYPSDNIVRVTASVGEAATRASYNESNLTEFGLCIINNLDSNYSYHGVKITKDASTNTWKPETQMLWKNAQSPVHVVAFTNAPGVNAFITTPGITSCCCGTIYNYVEQDQSDASDRSCDFLVYKKENFDPSKDLDQNGCIPIKFSHLLSQLNINLTFGTEFNEGQTGGYLTQNPITDIKVGGSIINAVSNFWPSTGDITTSADASCNAYDVTPHEVAGTFTEASVNSENAKVQYSCILVPQQISAGNFGVTFTIDGKLYVWKSSADFTLESGHQHALNLIIGKDVVELGTFSVKPWDDAATETLETE